MNILKDNKQTIIEFLHLELAKNQPKTYWHNPLRYKTDREILNYLINKGVKQ